MTWQELRPDIPRRNGVEIDIGDETYWSNDQYAVHRRVVPSSKPEIPPMIHLSIRNMDRSARHDWRDFQRIKNQLAGPEWEAMEIYPAESRLVDMANQYHLWCFDFEIGVGFQKRLVGNQAQADIVSPGAAQRDPQPVDLQYGGLSKIKEMKADNDGPPGDTYGRPKEAQ